MKFEHGMFEFHDAALAKPFGHQLASLEPSIRGLQFPRKSNVCRMIYGHDPQKY
jgi:hypothetical protein